MALTPVVVHGGQTWLNVEVVSVQGVGKIVPRLVVVLGIATAHEGMRARLLQLNAEVKLGDEVVGLGALIEVGQEVGNSITHARLSIPVTNQALSFIEENFVGPTLRLAVEFSGSFDGTNRRPMTTADATEVSAAFNRTPFQIAIPRSDWIHSVLQPVGYGDYVSLDFPLPPVPDRERWKKSLDHLRAADEQLLAGDDAGVLQHCRAAFERGALEGAPQHIFDGVADERKRAALNNLVKATVDFFHCGRHVSADGPAQGTFPVDHRDARFALSLAKLTLAYTGSAAKSAQTESR
jgi:hypothetical protein